MNVSKNFASAIAAASMVGAVGFAFAQTTSDPVTPRMDSTQTQPITPGNTRTTGQDASMQKPAEGSQGTQSGSTMPTDNNSASRSSSSTASPSGSNDNMAAIERAPRADRN